MITSVELRGVSTRRPTRGAARTMILSDPDERAMAEKRNKVRAYHREWSRKNVGKVRGWRAQWLAKNKARFLEAQRQWREKNKEHLRAYSAARAAEYRRTKGERLREIKRAWYAVNKERINAELRAKRAAR